MFLSNALSFQPGALVHAVFSPCATFARGGHYYSYETLHMTEVSRDIDARFNGYTTNVDHPHALETLVRLVLALPRLDPARGACSCSLYWHAFTVF